MHNCVNWHCSKDYCVKSILVNETFIRKLLCHTEMISTQCLWGNVLFGRELQIDAKKLRFFFLFVYLFVCLFFESTLYMKSGRMPLEQVDRPILFLSCVWDLTAACKAYTFAEQEYDEIFQM